MIALLGLLCLFVMVMFSYNHITLVVIRSLFQSLPILYTIISKIASTFLKNFLTIFLIVDLRDLYVL